MAISRGEVSSPSTPSIPLGVPHVSRLCPVQDRLSKARYENSLPAQSKSIECLFGRGRQSANPRTFGGLVMSEQARRFPTAPADVLNAAAGSKRAAIRVAWSACRDCTSAVHHQIRSLGAAGKLASSCKGSAG